ncbi:hypothetical protein UA08_02002 [Talaromyces atroroseus]|uniref:N-glycosylation protein EOS1 n=1 Tax=Talaromyces atroroseus TaxID=1441469 RepID=A0A1Q5QAZ1_TALAT|nr:hypothetical protein UA08_02002 [Talaromyces atroroseus]OKL63094.1 hypothetical protein UA08_02002 [Talaromyces atroroseus]
MNALGGTTTTPQVEAEDDEQDLDDVDDASTIVPPSPLNSRRNSLAHHGSHNSGSKRDKTGDAIIANRHQRRGRREGEKPPEDEESESESGSAAENEAEKTSAQLPSSKLSPRVAVILGVDQLLRIRPGMWREGWVAIIVSSAAADWDVERRFRVTEVALAIMWCCASAYLSYFFMDCMMSRWLLNYSPPAVLIRLLATNGLFAYLTSSVLFLSGASSDPRLLLPAWISITTTLTFLYHATQNHAMIKRETTASLSVLSVASYISMSLILLQMHLTRDNEPEVPAFVMGQKVLDWIAAATSTTISSSSTTTTTLVPAQGTGA